MGLFNIKTLSFLSILCLISFDLCNAQEEKLDFPEVKYSLGSWPVESFGNYRAVVEVREKANTCFIRLPWRRRDVDPHKKQIIVVDAKTDQIVKNVVCPEINREYGDVIFQPGTVPGRYYIYYMPYSIGHGYFPNTTYLTPEDLADPLWKASLPDDYLNGLDKGKLTEFQSADPFYRVDPMEVIATAGETAGLLERFKKDDYLLFPEKREFPIAMKYDLPLRWVRKGPSDIFNGEARPGEYFTFQIGMYALKDVENIKLEFESGQISKDAFTCFNTGGTDWMGKVFEKKLSVNAGEVQPLWCGVQIPDNFKGSLSATLVIKPVGMKKKKMKINIQIAGVRLADGGSSDINKMARLKWLNSTIGLDDETFGIYPPMTLKDDRMQILGHKIIFDESGLPGQIASSYDDMSALTDGPERKLLSAPVKFVALKGNREVIFKYSPHKVIDRASGAVTQVTQGTSESLNLECRSKSEVDGYMNYTITVTAKEDGSFNDMRLEIPYRKEIAEYMMGMGRKGGTRPKNWSWKWDIESSNSVFWLGTVGAGLQCRLKGQTDTWEIFNYKDTGIPEDWYNQGKGGCDMQEKGDSFFVQIFSGNREMKKGDQLTFRFGLLMTPVRPLDNDHWQWRYWHSDKNLDQLDSIDASGANIINIHHANGLNPYINYPFVATDTLAPFVARAHQNEKKVKLYYTVRELSVRAPETFALRSLGDEVYRTGEGFRLADRFTLPTETGGVTGESWLCEHLINDYLPAWHHYFSEGHWDASIAQSGLSRWHNYYLEGLDWLVREVGIDGIYLDGLGYDREIMKRVRKVMDKARPGSLIDFHCGNHFHPQYGMNNISNFFMEHFPFINSLWLGEGFDYNETPDYWLIELAGIPYGLYSETLGNNNPFRGMVYGMSERIYGNSNPSEIWKLWDDFGIQGSKMLGYWSKRCPVKTGETDVKATAYVKDGKTLIAIGNWGGDKSITLDIDWDAIGLDKNKAIVKAPLIRGVQEEQLFPANGSLKIGAERGMILIINE